MDFLLFWGFGFLFLVILILFVFRSWMKRGASLKEEKAPVILPLVLKNFKKVRSKNSFSILKDKLQKFSLSRIKKK